MCVPRQSRGGDPRPRHSLGEAGTRKCRAAPHLGKRGRCGDDQPEACPAVPSPTGRPRTCTRCRTAGSSDRSMAQATRDPRLVRVPPTGPALESCVVKFAKRVVQQELRGLTPHNAEFNITAGTTGTGPDYPPLERGALARHTTFQLWPNTSRPFDGPKPSRIVVKVGNHLGDEVVKMKPGSWTEAQCQSHGNSRSAP